MVGLFKSGSKQYSPIVEPLTCCLMGFHLQRFSSFFWVCVCVLKCCALYPEELGSVFLENFLCSGLGWLLFHSFIWHVLWPLHFWEICHCVRILIRFGQQLIWQEHIRGGGNLTRTHKCPDIRFFLELRGSGVGVLSHFSSVGLELLVVNAWTNSLYIHPFPSSRKRSVFITCKQELW